MIAIEDIYSLTDFQRDAKRQLASANRTGRPKVLTVNGKAQGVLLGKKAYQQIQESLEELAALKSIQVGLDDLKQGRTVSAADAHLHLRSL
jgi:prevent-host-death family protein